MVLKTISLETCRKLAAAGYPQDIKLGQHYYDIGHKQRLPVYAVCPFKAHDECIAIPTLEPFLDWFVKFAERWAEKMGKSYWYFKFDRSAQDKAWNIALEYDPPTELCDCEIDFHNPDPLTAVLELFEQMDEEMSDEPPHEKQ